MKIYKIDLNNIKGEIKGKYILDHKWALFYEKIILHGTRYKVSQTYKLSVYSGSIEIKENIHFPNSQFIIEED